MPPPIRSKDSANILRKCLPIAGLPIAGLPIAGPSDALESFSASSSNISRESLPGELSAFSAHEPILFSQARQPNGQSLLHRRGSAAEGLSQANKEIIAIPRKMVTVRSPRRGRSKSIFVPNIHNYRRVAPICRLNNYSKDMKKHRGPLSFRSSLESIDEVEVSGDNLDAHSN